MKDDISLKNLVQVLNVLNYSNTMFLLYADGSGEICCRYGEILEWDNLEELIEKLENFKV